MRPFHLTAPEPLELDIHEALARALDALLPPPAFWACYPAGHVQLAPHETARLARLGLKRGLPDIIIWYFGTWGLEVKRRGGRLSKTRVGRTRKGSPRILEGQADVFPKLIASGGFAAIGVVHNVDEALAQLASWGIPLRVPPPHRLIFSRQS
jgi:hypothetical protein